MTKYYRFLNKNGGFTWIQSCATLINSSSSNATTSSTAASGKSPTGSSSTTGDEQEQCVIAINYIIRSVLPVLPGFNLTAVST